MNKKTPIAIAVIIILVISFLSLLYLLTAYPKKHNIAIRKITPSTVKIYGNSTVEVNVTVENEGDFLETFNVTLYSNDTIIETLHSIKLEPKTTSDITFTWDTSNFPTGNYYIKAEASILPDETNTTDNTLVYGPVMILSKPVVFVNPAEITVHVGESFNVTVNIEGIFDLYGGEFRLDWNSEVLDLVKIAEGDFLKSGGETLFQKYINETAGRSHIVFTLLGDVPGVTGNGILATFTFYGKTNGESDLQLYDTNLGDSDVNPIPHIVHDGHVKVCATVFIYPATQKVAIDEEFTISVKIENVVNMCGYEFRIKFNNILLKGINASVPNLFGEDTQIYKCEVNNTLGRIWIAVISTSLTPLSGNYTLCQIYFHAAAKGNASLSLYEVKFSNEEVKPIPIMTSDGLIEVDPPENSGITDAQSDSVVIFVDPAEVSAEVGQYFTIRINISNVIDLYGWEFKLSWNFSLIEAVSVTEGDFLKSGGETFFYKNVNNTAGYLHATCTLLGDVAGVSGNGTLAEITFYIKSDGETILHLYDTNLGDSNVQPIPHVTEDGYCIFTKSSSSNSLSAGSPHYYVR
ncbi:hypothetical protein J7K06_00880 [Candidatus Bathyarchaeota archaeon]|nr:hypothetical protein [Candidatus Bathyarchaeota archaeon]